MRVQHVFYLYFTYSIAIKVSKFLYTICYLSESLIVQLELLSSSRLIENLLKTPNEFTRIQNKETLRFQTVNITESRNKLVNFIYKPVHTGSFTQLVHNVFHSFIIFFVKKHNFFYSFMFCLLLLSITILYFGLLLRLFFLCKIINQNVVFHG